MTDLTTVELLWLEKRIENRIRFGRAVAEQIIDRRRRILSFAPGTVFAFVRWASNDFGTVISRVDILQRRNARTALFDGALGQARWRHFVAADRLAESRARSATDRCRRGARHPSRRRRAGILASRPQPLVGERDAAAVHPRAPSGLAASAENRAMKSRTATILMTFAAVALVLSTMDEATPTYIWNASRSVPIGLYQLQPAGRLAVTELVAVRPPEPLATFLDLNGYLPIGVPMLKRVLALPGQTVCRKGLTISVDAIEMGEALARDSRGRPLPVWQGCRVVGADELFLMNWQSEDSLDGRYFGFVPNSSVIGKALPVWTREE